MSSNNIRIENRTKKTLWFDHTYTDNSILITEEENADKDNAWPIAPHESVILDIDLKVEGFGIQDKNGRNA